MKTVDIVLCVIPVIHTRSVTLGPALLKSYLSEAGFSSKIIDFNIRLYAELTDETRQNVESFLLSMSDEHVRGKTESFEMIENWANEILSHKPKFIACSVFSFQSQKATKILVSYLKQKSPDTKILLGGSGLSSSGIANDADFADNLQKKGIIDYYIRGAGEESLVQLLKGNVSPSVNSFSAVTITHDFLKNISYPNFDDYDFNQFELSLPIMSSRGCIRKCSFCDVHQTSKYHFRTGESVFNEMKYQSQKYKISHFHFTDSLNNGHLKEFVKLLTLLDEYNSSAANPIKWGSQYIIRSEKQLPENYWHLMSKSAAQISIGIETGSDRVREHMNKRFTNADIEYTFKKCEEYNIPIHVMIIVGYPTETIEDFNETLSFFSKYQHLAKKNIIQGVQIGNGLSILPNTPLMDNIQKLNIDIDEKFIDNWIANDNPDLTFQERILRAKILNDHVKNLGYNLPDATSIDRLENEIPYYEKRNKIRKIIKIKEQKKIESQIQSHYNTNNLLNDNGKI